MIEFQSHSLMGLQIYKDGNINSENEIGSHNHRLNDPAFDQDQRLDHSV